MKAPTQVKKQEVVKAQTEPDGGKVPPEKLAQPRVSNLSSKGTITPTLQKKQQMPEAQSLKSIVQQAQGRQSLQPKSLAPLNSISSLKQSFIGAVREAPQVNESKRGSIMKSFVASPEISTKSDKLPVQKSSASKVTTKKIETSKTVSTTPLKSKQIEVVRPSLESAKSRNIQSPPTSATVVISSLKAPSMSKIGKGSTNVVSSQSFIKKPVQSNTIKSGSQTPGRTRPHSLIGSGVRKITTDDNKIGQRYQQSEKDIIAEVIVEEYKVDQQDHSPFSLAEDVTTDTQEINNQSTDTKSKSKFGFKGGKQFDEGMNLDHSRHHSSPAKKVNIQNEGHTNITQCLNRVETINPIRSNIATNFDHAQLEETIKSLEMNLANLPTTISRVSRVRERSSLREKFAQREFNKGATSGNMKHQASPDNLGDPVETSFPQKFNEQLVQIEEEEKVLERNLPLTAFLPKNRLTIAQTRQQQLNDHTGVIETKSPFNPPIGDDNDEMLFEEDELFEQITKNDNYDSKFLEPDMPFGVAEESLVTSQRDKNHVGTNEYIPKLHLNGLIMQAETDQSVQSEKGQERVSLTAQFKKKSKLEQKKKGESMKSPLAKQSIQPLLSGRLSSISSSSNNLSMTQVMSNTCQTFVSTAATLDSGPQKLGLNPCQRQGPALAAKKAFQHKKKRFARELDENHDGLSECQHCCRRFNQKALAIHTEVCDKVFIRKRKAFLSLRQRALDEEHFKQVEMAQTKFAYYNDNQKLNIEWRKRRAQFKEAIDIARGIIPQAIEDSDDRVQCSFCLKKFAPTTAQRHIPLCESKAKDIKIKRQRASTALSNWSKNGKGV